MAETEDQMRARAVESRRLKLAVDYLKQADELLGGAESTDALTAIQRQLRDAVVTIEAQKKAVVNDAAEALR
jgi:hypothetical protein